MSPDRLPPSALASWDEIVRRAGRARLALFLDYDGTLAPIAPTPDEALLPEATREALARAAARYPVAVLSGRAREDVEGKVGLPGLVYAGNHGFDLEGPGLDHAVSEGVPKAIAAAAERLRAEIGGIPGVLLEPKRFSLSVHYRLAPEARVPEIERAVDAALAAHPALRKGLGKKLFELRPALDWDKGKALLQVLGQLGLDGPGVLPFYLGDDQTDEDAFRALQGRGIGILVADAPRETAAAYSLGDPAEVREFLDRLAALPLARAEAEREALLARERQARAEAEEANRVKDEFLATISHELRTPLNVIVSWAHLLRAQKPDPATLERGLLTIERNVAAQMQIIEDILDVSRIIRGSLALSLQPVDLAAVALQAIESQKPGAEAKGVAIETRLPEGPEAITVLGDPNRLRQVIWNLLSNAVKFTPRGGRVEIAMESGEEEVRLVFADTGQGIAPEFLPHVFERFRQADGSTTRVHGGLGLGLAIVRHLIELHGGTVAAESPGLGQGARFTVTLPAPAAVPAAVREAVSQP